MTSFLLIRHGENDYLKKKILVGTMPGVILNPRGIEQAHVLADSLKGFPIKAIYSSPLERAVQTARPLAEILDLEVEIRSGLSDPDVGEWTGKKLKALRKEASWIKIQETPSQAGFPGGETLSDVQKRLVGEMDSIHRSYKPNDLVAVVFHADPIKMVLVHYLNIHLDLFQRFSVDTGSITVLRIQEQGAYLLGLNLKPPCTLPDLIIR
jgi:probable phosphomutase (TIGR03848 family)